MEEILDLHSCNFVNCFYIKTIQFQKNELPILSSFSSGVWLTKAAEKEANIIVV